MKYLQADSRIRNQLHLHHQAPQNYDEGEGVSLCDVSWFNVLDVALSLRQHYWILKTDHAAKRIFQFFSGILRTKIIY